MVQRVAKGHYWSDLAPPWSMQTAGPHRGGLEFLKKLKSYNCWELEGEGRKNDAPVLVTRPWWRQQRGRTALAGRKRSFLAHCMWGAYDLRKMVIKVSCLGGDTDFRTVRRSNQSILKEINPEYSPEDWRWSSNPFATWCKDPTLWKRPWCWERLRAGETDDSGWDGWWWWWKTGKPGVLQSLGSQRVRHDWASDWKTTDFRGNNIQI